MENKEIASVLKMVGQLMELHDEEKFKTRSYTNASFQISKYPHPLRELDDNKLLAVPGVGKNLVPKIRELIDTGEMSYLNQWLEKTPEGLLEILRIKGIGPSKVRLIWKEMEIETVGELLYACNENRLIDLKGFGEKTQAQVKQSIEFMMDSQDKFLYATVEPLIQDIKNWISGHYPNSNVSETGAALRRDLIISELEFVISDDVQELPDTSGSKVKVAFHRVSKAEFENTVFEKSCTKVHLDAFYGAGIDPVIPEMRDNIWFIDWSKKFTESDLVTDDALLGSLHNHTTYSDGVHSLEEMAVYLKSLDYEYFGVCDHSKSAFYANGLQEDRIIKQHKEIDLLNERLSPFKIFKGIESDILMDGSLDYTDDILQSFDFIVASVHSVLRMDKNTATNRLIKAVENPYTTILGHPTGRLLLSRQGYPIDHKKVIDACAANKVVIELNANPMRLDIDYTWIPYCMERGVMVSINPDAHRKEGFHHMRYGVMSARKGGLTKGMTLNALALKDIESYFRSKS
jgi:DNA polymerase (family 10)